MNFSPIAREDIDFFRSLVDPDRFSTGQSSLDMHSRDQSYHGPYWPEAVLWPLSADEVSRVLAYAQDRRIPVTAWGSGSSLEGNPLPVAGGLVLNFTRMNRIRDIRLPDFQADVEPGVIYQDLNHRLRQDGLFFPPDPGARATIGGMIANNASGTRTLHYGSTRDYVLRLQVALANGEIIETGTRAAKTSSGYDLTDLFIGSEGTLGIVVAATLRLTGRPEESTAVAVAFDSVASASQAVFHTLRAGLAPASLELMDPATVGLINDEDALGLPQGAILLIEFHSSSKFYLREAMNTVANIVRTHAGRDVTGGLNPTLLERIWAARHRIGEIMRRRHPDYLPLVVDVAVPLGAYPDLMALADSLVRRAGVPGYVWSHAGDGNIHVSLLGRRGRQEEWDSIHRLNDALVNRALELGGTATGEHGVGLGKKKFMVREHGAGLEWMRKVKQVFDPEGILNPGKMF